MKVAFHAGQQSIGDYNASFLFFLSAGCRCGFLLGYVPAPGTTQDLLRLRGVALSGADRPICRSAHSCSSPVPTRFDCLFSFTDVNHPHPSSMLRTSAHHPPPPSSSCPRGRDRPPLRRLISAAKSPDCYHAGPLDGLLRCCSSPDCTLPFARLRSSSADGGGGASGEAPRLTLVELPTKGYKLFRSSPLH